MENTIKTARANNTNQVSLRIMDQPLLRLVNQEEIAAAKTSPGIMKIVLIMIIVSWRELGGVNVRVIDSRGVILIRSSCSAAQSTELIKKLPLPYTLNPSSVAKSELPMTTRRLL